MLARSPTCCRSDSRSTACGCTPEKTKLVRFEKPNDREPPEGGGAATSFDLLGFTHFWGESRKGSWVVKRKTAKDRYRRTLRRISEWCQANRHLSINEQHDALTRKLRGHHAYYGITGNARVLSMLRQLVRPIWYRWLARRSWRSAWTWARMNTLLARLPLPPARVVHSIYRAAKRDSTNRMREIRTSGSVGALGAISQGHPA